MIGYIFHSASFSKFIFLRMKSPHVRCESAWHCFSHWMLLLWLYLTISVCVSVFLFFYVLNTDRYTFCKPFTHTQIENGESVMLGFDKYIQCVVLASQNCLQNNQKRHFSADVFKTYFLTIVIFPFIVLHSTNVPLCSVLRTHSHAYTHAHTQRKNQHRRQAFNFHR